MTCPIEAKNSWNSCMGSAQTRPPALFVLMRARECFELISMETRQIKGHLRQLFLLLSLSRPSVMCSLFSLSNGSGRWFYSSSIAAADDARVRIKFILLIPNGETRYSLSAFFLLRAMELGRRRLQRRFTPRAAGHASFSHNSAD